MILETAAGRARVGCDGVRWQALASAEHCGSKCARARLDSAKKASLWLDCGLQGEHCGSKCARAHLDSVKKASLWLDCGLQGERCGSRCARARLDSAKKASLRLDCGLQGETTLRAPGHKEQQCRKQAPARLNRVRSVVTLEVTLIVRTKARVHLVCLAEESGQLGFPG